VNIVSRKYAMQVGLTRYFSGSKCVNGHVAERQTTNGACIPCMRGRQKIARNTESYRQRHRKQARKLYRADELTRLRQKFYALKNASKKASWGARYRQSPAGVKQGRKRHLRLKYSIKQQCYEKLLRAQDGRCAICSTQNPGKGRKHFAVDHNHKTGAIRGLLCNTCNISLGGFGDRAETLLTAAAYLRKHHG